MPAKLWTREDAKMIVKRNGGVATLFLKGSISAANAHEFEEELLTAADEAQGDALRLDAEELAYISSAGLRALVKLMKRCADRVSVVNASSEVYDVFDMTGFTTLMDVKRRMREVSVEGCELIGSGGFGKVYRLDEETIVKVYNPGISLEFVEQEHDVSQKAFLMGVPTAISYDVVKVGDCYGVVFEMLDAKTTAQIIEADPSQIPAISGASAKLLKELHAIVPGPDAGLPNRKQLFLEWVDSLAAHLTQEESDKIKAFLNAVPDRDTFLHGDYNAKNIMVLNGELQLIDIGDATIGHPVFDIAGLMLAYIILPNSRGGARSDEEMRALLGFDFDLAPKVWGVMCATYFGVSSQEEIGAITQKLMPYCLLLMSYQSVRISGADEQGIAMRVERVLRQRFLPALDNVAPLDF